MSADPKDLLIERIANLAGVVRSGDMFTYGDEEFVTFNEKNELELHLNAKGLKKLETALHAEPRVSPHSRASDIVTLRCETELDVEFVFIYVRYAWQCWQHNDP